MPEGRAIGIKCGHAVIAPASTGGGVGAGAVGHYSFPLCEESWRIAGKTFGIPNTGEDVAARCRIPDGYVSVRVGTSRGHKAAQTVVGVGPGWLCSRCG